MNKKHYSGGLTREQFMFHEMKTVAAQICAGASREDIADKIYDQNLFQYPTERMIRSITNSCFKRIDALDSDELVYELANNSADTAKQINLYAAMCENSVVYDFMTCVIGEKYKQQDFDFSAKDVNTFFMELAENVPKVSGWSDSTVKKIKQVLVRFLVECGYLESPRSQKLMPVYLNTELEKVLRERNENDVLASFNCLY